MFRKDRESRNEWSPANVEFCAARQRRIVHDVWDSLKPGGYFVYSTCTFNTEENEDNIVYTAGQFDAETVEIQTLPEWNVSGSVRHDIPVCRFFPHKTPGEGFFVAVLQKREGDFMPAKSKSIPFPKSNHRNTENLLSPERFCFIDNKAILKTCFNSCQSINNYLRVISAGIHLGEWKGKDFIPSVSLALSTALNREKYMNVELSYDEAIRYLQNEAIAVPTGTPKGFILVNYRGVPLGFVKNVGNRANNLYPKEWRIRKKMLMC
jgi:NOL1/NOP2/fmu family ribosome biogenesis protein